MKTWTTSGGWVVKEVLSGRSNVFLASKGALNILIDTSPAFMRKKLAGNLHLAGVKTIDYLILTHTHFDHAANACWIREKYGARVIVHMGEADLLSAGVTMHVKGTNRFTNNLIRLASGSFARFARYEPCKPDILVEEDHVIPESGTNVKIMHTPGHTNGSMSVIIDSEIAIVGDTMFGVFPRSVFPPFGDDPEEIVSSWGKLLETGCKIFLPSHGSPNGKELVELDYAKRINQRST